MFKQISIAGAGGFVGQALTAALHQHYPDLRLVGLSRSPKPPGRGIAEWRTCDLFSLLDAEKALSGSQAAYYLVHSMLPSAALTQGSFEDLDLIAADNFARAARTAGLQQIVYLGGLIPPRQSGTELSAHLASRLEVARALGAYGTPVTALHAGLVVGSRGSSFRILERLVRRLPLMLTPKWTETPTQPIAVDDIVRLLLFCLGKEGTYGETFDVGGPDVLTYRQMIETVARLLDRHPLLLRAPFFTPGLSRLWLSLITGAPKNLAKPLVQSLRHPMVAKDRRLQEAAGIPGRTFQESARAALSESDAREPRAFTKTSTAQERDARSVQRLPLPTGKDATWAAQEYLRWLPSIFPFVLRVAVSSDAVATIRLFGVRVLELAYSSARSTSDRALFYVSGGWLARSGGRARFELREVSQTPWLIAAVHDFRPRLPWKIYGWTQAKIHLWVMRAFGRHLEQLTRGQQPREIASEVN